MRVGETFAIGRIRPCCIHRKKVVRSTPQMSAASVVPTTPATAADICRNGNCCQQEDFPKGVDNGWRLWQ